MNKVVFFSFPIAEVCKLYCLMYSESQSCLFLSVMRYRMSLERDGGCSEAATPEIYLQNKQEKITHT